MSEWDKLWLKKPFTLDSLLIDDEGNSLQSDHAIWLVKVRAVGGKIQRDNKNLAYEIKVHKKKIVEQEQKLKAVQEWAKEILGENYEAFRHTRMNMNMLDWVPLRKILEGENDTSTSSNIDGDNNE